MSAASPEALSASFAAAINGGDADAALALWAHDAVIVGADGQSLSGHEQIAPALRALVSNGTQVEIEISRLYVAGDVAVVAGTLTITGTGQTAFRTRSQSTVVYKRGDDGRWRIALDAPWGLPAA